MSGKMSMMKGMKKMKTRTVRVVSEVKLTDYEMGIFRVSLATGYTSSVTTTMLLQVET